MKLLVFLFFVVFTYRFAATADQITYEGQSYPLYERPLQYLPRFQEWEASLIFGQKALPTATLHSEPYTSHWVIKDGSIYLQSIESGTLLADLEALFPGRIQDGLVFADWIDTTIYAPFGASLVSGVTVSESIYEYELAFKIRAGKVISVVQCDNTKTRVATEQGRLLKESIRKTIDWSRLPKSDSVDRTVWVQVVSSDSLGAIDSVLVVRGAGESYDREAIRIVKTVKDWPILYLHGKVVRGLVIPIRFEKAEKKESKDPKTTSTKL